MCFFNSSIVPKETAFFVPRDNKPIAFSPAAQPEKRRPAGLTVGEANRAAPFKFGGRPNPGPATSLNRVERPRFPAKSDDKPEPPRATTSPLSPHSSAKTCNNRVKPSYYPHVECRPSLNILSFAIGEPHLSGLGVCNGRKRREWMPLGDFGRRTTRSRVRPL